MIETELKISLDEVGEAALAAHAALERMRGRPRRTEDLVSPYCDTPDRALARRVAAELGRWGIEIDDSAGTVRMAILIFCSLMTFSRSSMSRTGCPRISSPISLGLV